MAAKQIATKLTTGREKVLAQLLNGEVLAPDALSCFACSSAPLTELCASLRDRFPGYTGAKQVGGLGKHHDGVILVEGTAPIRYELKHCEKVVPPEILEWQPWEGGVQFAQSQFKAKKAQVFMDGVAMYQAWFKERVLGFLARKPELALGGIVSFEDYYKASTSLDGHKKDTAAGRLLMALRGSKALQKELQEEWLRFEETWLPSHPLNHAAFETYVREIVEEKDLWIHISKSGAFTIEGFRVVSLDYKGIAKKRDGGCVFLYSMRLQKKGSAPDGETRDVSIQFKYTWKNGGQAIQNLNFLLVSA